MGPCSTDPARDACWNLACILLLWLSIQQAPPLGFHRAESANPLPSTLCPASSQPSAPGRKELGESEVHKLLSGVIPVVHCAFPTWVSGVQSVPSLSWFHLIPGTYKLEWLQERLGEFPYCQSPQPMPSSHPKPLPLQLEDSGPWGEQPWVVSVQEQGLHTREPGKPPAQPCLPMSTDCCCQPGWLSSGRSISRMISLATLQSPLP